MCQKRARMKLSAIYSPPNHPGKTVHKTKVEAEAEKEKNY